MAFTTDDATVLVTGGTGTFGQAFVEHLLNTTKVRRLIVYSRDELKQYEMRERLADPRLRFVIGDVRDVERLRRAFTGVQAVVHAAALKQVPAAEDNPSEYIKTNILGAENVVAAAIDQDVERVVALSSDKAANPVNLYGATKLCADKLFVAANHLNHRVRTTFAVVRYGNVIGSRGSVVELFRRLAGTGKTVPITDPRMTRFWITVEQGVEFVLKALHLMAGGEIFVPRIPSMRVVDVARALIPGASFQVIGIRSGEKLHEALIIRDEAVNTLQFDDFYVVKPTLSWWQENVQGAPWYESGRAVPADFEYSSDRNDRWLDAEGFRKLLEGTRA
jgi:UDP-N-acetylglucosamine 4,6-dehydratase